MLDESKLKSFLISILICAFIMYHITNYLFPVDLELFVVFKLIQIIGLIGMITFMFNSKSIREKLMPEDFYTGNYKGTALDYLNENSTEENPDQDKLQSNHITFSISQSLFKTTLSGRSISNGEINSSWNGILFKENNNTLYFALEIHSNLISEYGVLTLTFEKSDVYGLYYSGEIDSSHAFKVNAKKDLLKHNFNN